MLTAQQIQKIRENTGLTQAQFAARYHIPVRTLQKWEQGERVPHGPALQYLIVIKHRPDEVAQALQDWI